jgi:copper homeostasis protein
MTLPKLEVIAMSVADAVAAQHGGASSVEIVRDLAVGGLTPPMPLVQAIRDAVNTTIRVILRPHAQNFMYSEAEIEQMLGEIETLKAMGINGVVFGALHDDHTVDHATFAQVARAAAPLEVTFHRAIDESSDAHLALPLLRGVANRILTSGLAPNVWEGRAVIRQWVAQYGRDFVVACGGGIHLDHLVEMLQATNAPEIHVGTAARINGVVDSERVRAIAELITSTLRPPQPRPERGEAAE